jgi:Skp family chaperone for outer membrane proteins
MKQEKEVMRKINCLIIALAFLAAVAVSPVFAQPKPAQPTAPPTSATLPGSKIALINTDEFLDEKQGIARLIAAAKKADTAFEPTRKDLQQLQQRMQQLQDEITKLQQAPPGAGVDPRQIQTKSDQLEQLKTEAKRKQEDAEAAYPKRMQEALAPIYLDISKSLDAFGKARGITLLLDTAKMGAAILIASDALDITRAFINDFNSKNPATASVVPSPK